MLDRKRFIAETDGCWTLTREIDTYGGELVVGGGGGGEGEGRGGAKGDMRKRMNKLSSVI